MSSSGLSVLLAPRGVTSRRVPCQRGRGSGLTDGAAGGGTGRPARRPLRLHIGRAVSAGERVSDQGTGPARVPLERGAAPPAGPGRAPTAVA